MAAPHQENRQADQEDIYRRWIRRQGRKTIRTFESRIQKLENQSVEASKNGSRGLFKIREKIETAKAQRERMIQHFGRRSNQRAIVIQTQQEVAVSGGDIGGAPPATGGSKN